MNRFRFPASSTPGFYAIVDAVSGAQTSGHVTMDSDHVLRAELPAPGGSRMYADEPVQFEAITVKELSEKIATYVDAP